MAFAPEFIKEAVTLTRAGGREALADEAGTIMAAVSRRLSNSQSALDLSRKWGHEVPDVSSAGQKSTAILEALYGLKPIKFAERAGDMFDTRIKTGVIDAGSGYEHVVVTSPGAKREANELAAYAIHRESPFTNHFPVTVRRAGDGKLVQERVGRSLDSAIALLDKRFYRYEPPFMPVIDSDPKVLEAWTKEMIEHERNSPALHALWSRSPVFRDQLEQTVAERLLWGDLDGAPRNLTMQLKQQALKMSNIDMEFAFDRSVVPHAPHIEVLQGQAISPTTLDKIAIFHGRFSSKAGRDFLSKRIDIEQTEAMLSRSSWLLKEGHFPLPAS